MNEMNERVKILRKALDLTMEQFGRKLGVGKSAIADIESGRNNVSSQIVKVICITNWGGKYVNEIWLRTGEEDMFIPMDLEEELADLIATITYEPFGSFKRRLLSVLVSLTEEQWLMLADIAEKLAGKEAGE